MLLPSSEFLHLSILLLLQFGDKTLQDRHLKFDILCHLVEEKETASLINMFTSLEERIYQKGKGKERCMSEKQGIFKHLHHTWPLPLSPLPWEKPCRPAHMDPAWPSAPSDNHCASASHALEYDTHPHTHWLPQQRLFVITPEYYYNSERWSYLFVH